MLLGHGITLYCSCEFYQKMHKNLKRRWLHINFKIQYCTLTRKNKDSEGFTSARKCFYSLNDLEKIVIFKKILILNAVLSWIAF